MTRLLSICIPTYKRSSTLIRCIDSAVEQVEKYHLSETVGIYVANDASPDDSAELLRRFDTLSYVKTVTRPQNLGMSMNIKLMLQEVSSASSFQLIVTDDDYLESDMLCDIVSFLSLQQQELKPVPAIWTPRYSYTEDGELYCIVCDRLKSSSAICPSPINVGRYMENGFVLSGLILNAAHIDFEFWNEYAENAFFPVILLGDVLRTHGAFYWKQSIVHHTVLNECHWERWGKNDIAIELRLLTDFVNAYEIMAVRIGDFVPRLLYYGASLPSMNRRVLDMLISDKLQGDRKIVQDAIGELKAQHVFKFVLSIRLQMLIALGTNILMACAKILYCWGAVLVSNNRDNGPHRKRIGVNFGVLKTVPVVFKVIMN